MNNGILEAKVSQLIEQNKEMSEKINELEKIVEQNQKNDVHDFKEILNSIKEFSDSMTGLISRKNGIDKIIEKIKKILPI